MQNQIGNKSEICNTLKCKRISDFFRLQFFKNFKWIQPAMTMRTERRTTETPHQALEESRGGGGGNGAINWILCNG